MPSQANARLYQVARSGPGPHRRFEFVGPRRLRVTERTGRRKQAYEVDVVAIDPKARSSVSVPWNWLRLAALGVAAAPIGWLALGSGGAALALVLAASGGTAAAGLVMTIRGTSHRRVFVSCHARLPLLNLELNRPDPDHFNAFVAQLQQRIAEAREERKLEDEQHVAGEVRMLRRLTEAGVFEWDVYERARAALLEKF